MVKSIFRGNTYVIGFEFAAYFQKKTFDTTDMKGKQIQLTTNRRLLVELNNVEQEC